MTEEAQKECMKAAPAGSAPLRAVFLRSFFIQAAWNYERYQNLGFCFALEPVLRRLYPDQAACRDALSRHLQIVNTQPYMASFVLGNVARIETNAVAAGSGGACLKSLPGVKQALASSFAAIGDRIFWGRLKPMTALVCLLVWAAGGFYGWLYPGMAQPASVALLLAGPLAGIALYSAASVCVRWKGLAAGYGCGGSTNCALDSFNWPRLIKALSAAGFLMSLALAFIAFGTLAGMACASCRPADAALKLGLPLAAIGLQRLCRALDRSVFSAVGIILAASVLLFTVLGFKPLGLYL